MTRRRNISASERATIFFSNKGQCHICGYGIDASRERWDADHVIPIELGGDDTKGSDNIKPAHKACHAPKTATDVGHIAKGKRMKQRGLGIKRQSRNPMPGSRASGLKKRLDGTVVKR